MAATLKTSILRDIDGSKHVFDLLKLPAELRNKIYHYALVNDSLTEITTTLRPPPLLQSCRQVRLETRNIWCVQNTFFIRINNYDTTLLSRFCRILVGHMDFSPGIVYDFEGTCNWPNLIIWCRRVFHGNLWPVFAGPNADTEALIISAATRIAASDIHNRWHTCQQSLDIWREVAGKSNQEWLKE